MTFDLHGHTALITGATQGIGACIARALAEAGCDVLLHGLQDDETARAALAACRGAGVRAELCCVDLAADTEAAVKTLSRLAERFAPRVDLLVNNAGGYFDVPYLDLDYVTFDRTMRLNVYAYFFLTQRFARRWVADGIRGRVLMIGSINGLLAEPTHAAYDTSKGAVAQMVRTLCVELAPQGIRINGIAPGLFETPLTRGALEDPRMRAWMQLHTPNRVVPGPDVIAGAAQFLLSDAAEHIHGQMLFVDGGMSCWQQPGPPVRGS